MSLMAPLCLQLAHPSLMGLTAARFVPVSTGPPVTPSMGNASVPLAGWDPPACRVSPACEFRVQSWVMVSQWGHGGTWGKLGGILTLAFGAMLPRPGW